MRKEINLGLEQNKALGLMIKNAEKAAVKSSLTSIKEEIEKQKAEISPAVDVGYGIGFDMMKTKVIDLINDKIKNL
jgi:hypothetical protein